jgi:hypothetical protein
MASSRKGFISRQYRYQSTSMVNICDEELVGRTLVDGNLKVAIDGDYFSGERVDAREALRLVRETDVINLVGDRIVNKVIREKLAHPRAVRKIGGVPFLMIYKFNV